MSALQQALAWEDNFQNNGQIRPFKFTLALMRAGYLYDENSCDCLNDNGLRAMFAQRNKENEQENQ